MMQRRATPLALTIIGVGLILLGWYPEFGMPVVLIGGTTFVASALTASLGRRPSQSDVFYVIGVFDMLGQKRQLHKPSKFPPINDVELQETKRMLQQTVAPVRQFRELFQGLDDEKRTFNEYKAHVPEVERAQFRSALAPRITTWGFSDTYCVAIPLEAGSRDAGLMATLANVCRLLDVAAEAWLVSLGNNQPIRGGIEIGPATSIRENEVYGLALAEAHRIESTVAKHPRIVLGGALVTRLYGLQKHADGVDKLAKVCWSKLKVEVADGQPEINVLGSWATPERRLRLRDSFERAHKNVRCQLEEHKSAGDKKLISRYEVLLHYFDDHAERWDNADQ